MAITYEPIATTTLSSAAATIAFSSIPATWTDLRVVLVNKGGTAACRLLFNTDITSSTNYSTTSLIGTGSGAASARATSGDRISLEYYGMDATIPSVYTADIFSYAGSTYKTVLGTAAEDFNGSGSTSVRVGLWRSTAAITAVTLLTTGTAFQSGTTATLIGIKAA
jgi:hypothetical protein